MSITAATILDRAAELLLDTAHRTWSADELLDLLNEALSATALVKHDFYTVQDFVTLAAGVLQLGRPGKLGRRLLRRRRVV